MGTCIHLAIERDTRGLQLSDAQRFNYYPASPLPMMSWIFEGDLHMVEEPLTAGAAPSLAPALPRLVISGPHRKPSASWSPGPVHALSVAIYPQAWSTLLGIPVEAALDRNVPVEAVTSAGMRALLAAIGTPDGREPFERLEAALLPLWQDAPGSHGLRNMRGWLQSMAVRAAFSKAGIGMRNVQRRIRAWTGQSHRDLQLYMRTERALVHASAGAFDAGTAPSLASVAAAAGFADQSHLGREVRRVTGLSPARLAERMKTDEAFWFYRLLSSHLQSQASVASD